MRFRLGFSLALAFMLCAHPRIAHAGTITTIDFSKYTEKGPSPLGSTIQRGYHQGGYGVYKLRGGLELNPRFGNPAQSITGFSDFSALTVVQDAGGSFIFNSFDLNVNGDPGSAYRVYGILDGNTVFDTGFTKYSEAGYQTLVFLDIDKDPVSSVTIVVTDPQQRPRYAIDNIVVSTVTPEGSTLMLVGTGLMGILSTVRRRAKTSE